jgi:hypothetical protein
MGDQYNLTAVAKKRWNPLQLIDMIDAVKAHKKTALIQGELYEFRYEAGDRFWFCHAENHVPCGYKTISRLELELAGL